jgi:hypothetical protein
MHLPKFERIGRLFRVGSLRNAGHTLEVVWKLAQLRHIFTFS